MRPVPTPRILPCHTTTTPTTTSPAASATPPTSTRTPPSRRWPGSCCCSSTPATRPPRRRSSRRVATLRDAIDWQAGFHVDADDAAAAIDAIGQLAARFDVRIDWGVDDPSDEDFVADIDVPGVIGIAFDRLREHHYTLWTWDAGHDHHAGWITRQDDDEAVQLVAAALGFHVRPGSG